MLKINGTISQRGFTVIELFVVMVIMGVVISVAAISIFSSLRQNRLRDATRELEGEIMMIRNVARTQQTRVVSQITSTNISAFSYIDVNKNGVFDAGVDTASKFLDHTYENGVQFAVTSIPGAGALAPLTTIQFNEAGNITDANRVITITMNSEPVRQYRIWIFTTGSTRVVRSDDGGVNWPMRPW
jgi:prepilin-type N-terminal cleavage/methylation domain-containing protein